MNGSNPELGADGDRRYRIAFVMPPWFDVPPQAYGGIELVVGNLIEALIDRGHDVVMIGAGKNGTRARFLQTYAVAPSERIGEPVPEVLQTAWSNRYLDDLEVDIIHDHSLAGPLTARGRKVPTVVTAHGPVTGEFGSYYRDLAQEVALVAISDAQRRLAPHMRWAATVHNAIKAADFRFRETKDDYVLFLGRFNPEKGAHLAIDAAREAGRSCWRENCRSLRNRTTSRPRSSPGSAQTRNSSARWTCGPSKSYRAAHTACCFRSPGRSRSAWS